MRHFVAKLIPTFLVGGCSLIYNPNNITKPPTDASDAQTVDTILPIDAPFDAPPLADANPAALTVESVFPPVIYEGQGVDNSPPAMLVIKGHHFIAGATVTVTPATDLALGAPVISANGDYIAVPITAAINLTTDAGDIALTVAVNESGATAPATVSGQLTLTYLKQIVATTTTLQLPLETRYSRVVLAANPAFNGDASAGVIIHSMSSITCGGGTGAFTAKGNTPPSPPSPAAGPGGPGGCNGGAQGAHGGCTGVVGGGGAGAAPNGGGGGGFGAAGTQGGGGANGGTGGEAHGNAQVVSYVGSAGNGSDRNQASGGGGGTTNGISLGGYGGGGGGGGGTVEMTAGGDIKCGMIDVTGGNGSAGNSGGTGSSGGGGGGAGGLIVMRTSTGTIMNASLAAGGGSGGGGSGTGATAGGDGGAGRIRVDAPGTLPSSSPTGVLHRGLAFAASTMNTYTVPSPMLTIVGNPNDVFDMYVVDTAGVVHTGEPLNQTIDGTGMATVPVSLLPGYNRLCATIRPGVRDKDNAFSLADTCVVIAYLP